VEVEGAYTLNGDRAAAGVAAGDGKDVFLGSQGVIFDITKYKKAEFERLELHKRLFQIQKADAIGKLAGKVAHDLNNKLGSIIGTTEILRQELQPFCSDTMAAYIDNLLSASRHAAELSNKLTEFSRRGESGFVRLNFHEVLDNVMALGISIAGGNISVHKILLSKTPYVMGSETMLQNAVLNLVINAFEAMKHGGGVLTIETADINAGSPGAPKKLYRRGSYLKISVQDTGVGMDEEVKSRLFDPFFTTNSEKGLGLGLVSIRECVRSHGGVIDIQSEPGKGSRFDVYLPKAGD
jgi:signal transduction histidine kinase